MSIPPDWQLPRGVPRGTWQYAHSDEVTGEYDAEFAENSLFQFDLSVLERIFVRPGVLADLGCGTGRLLLPFAKRGFRCVAVDLSPQMLQIVKDKSLREGARIERLRANLVELGCLADRSADYCISMFSTLGMIRGKDNRRRALEHVRRVLRPEGVFVLHVHNRWQNLFMPGGRAWLLSNWWRSCRDHEVEMGDKTFDYRDVAGMFLHVFTRSEFVGALREAGFRIDELIPLNTQRRHALSCPWWFGRLRANGWIAICRPG